MLPREIKVEKGLLWKGWWVWSLSEIISYTLLHRKPIHFQSNCVSVDRIGQRKHNTKQCLDLWVSAGKRQSQKMTQLCTQPPFYGKGRITHMAEQWSKKMEPRTLEDQHQVAVLASNQETGNVWLTTFKLLYVTNPCTSISTFPLL